MDFMKVFDQTVKELKREVNLKVLKVPEIEQKVLDSTDNEPWGPHGSALVEIAQATKKFTECQMVMNVLWQRITETGKDWRYVYKALAVIEYLVAHGSERAVDEIIEHTFQISALTSFEYVEPSGKDMGTNVRKKAENIVNLLNNRDKIQEVRNKAAANRDKYVGLSSTGIKSGSAFYGSSSYQNSDHYGGLSGTSNRYRDNFKDGDHNDEKKIEKDTYGGSRSGVTSENQGATNRKDKKSVPVGTPMSKSSSKSNDNDNYSSVRAQNSIAPNNYEDDFDDFDPRGTTTSKAAGSSNQVDLLGQDLIGDLMDAPAVLPTENPPMDSTSSDVDLFADAAFVAAPPKIEIGAASQTNNEVDLFASKPAMSSASPTVDLFASTNPVQQPEIKSTNIGSTNTNIVDPFATVPLNNFDRSDLFGAFTSHLESATSQPSQISVVDGNQKNLGGNVSADLKAPAKKDSFQVKSGIWADSLSRGLIDLNISAPKKVNLADIGVVGELTDGSDGKEKGPTTSYFMGRAMGAGSGLGRSSSSEFAPSKAMGGDDFFSSLNGTQYQYGGFQK